MSYNLYIFVRIEATVSCIDERWFQMYADGAHVNVLIKQHLAK